MSRIASKTSRKLIPPLDGPLKLYPNEQALYDGDRSRLKGANVTHQGFEEDGRRCDVLLLEHTAELVVVHGFDAEGNELPWNERMHELLGTVERGEGVELSDVVELRRRTAVLLLNAEGDIKTLRNQIAGWETQAHIYPNERAFVAAFRERVCPQHDYGFGWREGGFGFRVGFVPQTNEVIAVLRGPRSKEGRVELLGQVVDKDELDRLMRPLWRLHGKNGSLARVRGALASVTPSPLRAPRRRPRTPLFPAPPCGPQPWLNERRRPGLDQQAHTCGSAQVVSA
jgi:hypothetical protein